MVVLVFAVCTLVNGYDRVCANRKRDRRQDRVRMFVRRVESVCNSGGCSLCAALALGRQPECKCLWHLSCALRVCRMDPICGAALDAAGFREGHCGVACRGGNQLDDGSTYAPEQADRASGLVQSGQRFKLPGRSRWRMLDNQP